MVQSATIRDHITAPRLAHVFKTLQIFNGFNRESLLANLRVAAETTTPNNVLYVKSVVKQIVDLLCVGRENDEQAALKQLLLAFDKTLDTVFGDVVNGAAIVSFSFIGSKNLVKFFI